MQLKIENSVRKKRDKIVYEKKDQTQHVKQRLGQFRIVFFFLKDDLLYFYFF